MKKIMNEWRTFRERQILSEEQDQLETVGDLMNILANISRDKKLGFAKELGLDIAVDAANIATFGVGRVLATLWKKTQQNPNAIASQNPTFQRLMIDPFVSRVVDDEIEEAFLDELAKEFEGKDPEDRLENYDMTGLLAKYIAKDYDNTVVKHGGS
jgi:hypothetical protein